MSGNFDLFDLPEQGSARSVGSKFGNVAGVSTDVVWPESNGLAERYVAVVEEILRTRVNYLQRRWPSRTTCLK